MVDKPLNPLPYYKWYWQDFRANRMVQRMTYVERGLYRELLDECWSEGGIPSDMESLADICGCPVDVIANAWQVLGKCFCLVDGCYRNEKLDSLRTDRDAIRVKRKDAGRLGGIRKSLNEKDSVANANQVPAGASVCHIGDKRRVEESRGEKIAADAPKKPSSGKKKKAEWVTAEHMTSTLAGLTEPVATGYLAFRRSKGAALTDLAWKSIAAEVVKSGMSPDSALPYAMNRGWRGFDSTWIPRAGQPSNGGKPSKHDLSQMDYSKGADADGKF